MIQKHAARSGMAMVITFLAITLSTSVNSCTSSQEKVAEPSHTGAEVAAKMKDMGAMMVQMLGMADENYDDRFISTMTMHHMGATLMAKDALAKSSRQDIRDLAQKMIDAQQKEIDSLRAWDLRWFGHEPMLDPAMMRQDTQHVAMLGPVSAQYDDNFLDAMIEHHTSAILMAQDALQKSSHQEIKTMSQAIISSQSAEIDSMKSWRMNWYQH